MLAPYRGPPDSLYRYSPLNVPTPMLSCPSGLGCGSAHLKIPRCCQATRCTPSSSVYMPCHRLSPRAKGHFIRLSVLTIDEKSSFTNQSHNRNNHKTTGFRANGRVIQTRGHETALVRGNNLFIWAPPGADGICLSIKLEAQTLTPQLGLWFLAADATRSWRHVLLLSIPPQVP